MFDENGNEMVDDIAGVMGGSFDAGSHETVSDFTPVPAGEYQVFIEKAEMKPTKKEDGWVLYLTMIIMDEGEYNSRKIFQRINVRNQSVQAQEIGQKMLATLGQALGILSISSTSQLENQVVMAKVKVTKGDEQYGPQNEVINYKAIDRAGTASNPPAQASEVKQPVTKQSQSAQSTQPGAGTTKPVQKAAGGKLPWQG